jgi:transposase
MTYYIGWDQHKQYSIFRVMNEKGDLTESKKVNHEGEMVENTLKQLPTGSEVAVEATGNWYWLINEMEKHGLKPQLTHPRKAKVMMGQINKTDNLDAGGLARLLRNGTLPRVWIPPQELRDQRELLRFRSVLRKIRTGLKNRIHATLAKYAITINEVSDIFGVSGKELIKGHIKDLPCETGRCVEDHLLVLAHIQEKIEALEERIKILIQQTPEMQLLQTIPGVGVILSATIASEIGDIERFSNAKKLASYAGTTPRIKSSGGKTYFGQVRCDVNRYLKWAYVEAANCIVLQKKRWGDTYLMKIYDRIKERRGHAKAIVGLARTLAESSYWMLKKKEAYKIPSNVSSTQR